jgi:hypothetical protein
MPKTLLEKLRDGEWKKFTEEEKRDFLDGHARRIGYIFDIYKYMEKFALEQARKRIIGSSYLMVA